MNTYRRSFLVVGLVSFLAACAVASATASRASVAGTWSGSYHGAFAGRFFGVVKVAATYTGSVSGTSMSGKYNTPQGGGSWSARKTA